MRHQADGELDDDKLVDGLTGDRYESYLILSFTDGIAITLHIM